MPDRTPTRILVVDDDASTRLILRAHLIRARYNVQVADGMPKAIELLSDVGATPFEAVVTDYWMPGGTGLELLRHVQQLDPTLAVIIVTAEKEKSIVAQTLRSGGNDFLEKPISGPALLDSVARAVTATRHERALRATAEAASALGRSQLRLLQRHMATMDPRIQLFFHSHADASGDFITVFPLDTGRFVLLASDASGHDIQAAFQSNYFHGLARGMIERGAGMEDVFCYFNDLLLTDWNSPESVDLSIAALGITIDLDEQTAQQLNCGFPAPMLSGPEGWAAPLAKNTLSAPLGWFDEMPAISTTALVGGYLTLWSDGLADIADLEDVDPLAVARRLLGEDTRRDQLIARAKDDVAVVRVAVGPEAIDPKAAHPIFAQIYRGEQLAEIDALQAFFDRSLHVALPRLPDDRLADITLCAREALLNALQHGCAGRPDGLVTVQAATTAGASVIALRIADEGPGHDFDLNTHERAAADNLLCEHRGLVMMKNLATSISFSGRGTCVTMEFTV